MASGSREVGTGDHFSPDFGGEETKVTETVLAESASSGKDKSEHSAEKGRQDPDEGPWLPDRVRKALEKSRNFDEFRKSRPFRFLHLFSGERDQLGESVRKEAKRARLEIYVESLDRKTDSELNLADPKLYDKIEKSIGDGEWDGFHSGFPCGSFSRVRWRESIFETSSQ